MQTAPDNVLQVELSNEKYERECIYHSPIGCWKEGFSIHAKEADQVDSNDSGTMSARKRCLPWDSSLWKSCFRLEAPEPGKNTLSSQIAKLARSAGKSHMPLQAETIAHDDLIWSFFPNLLKMRSTRRMCMGYGDDDWVTPQAPRPQIELELVLIPIFVQQVNRARSRSPPLDFLPLLYRCHSCRRHTCTRQGLGVN